MILSSNTISRPRRILAVGLAAALLWSGPGAAEVDAVLDPAIAALERGDGIAAQAELDRALERGARRNVVAARMGEAMLQQGNLDAARDWLAPRDFVGSERAHGFRMLGRLEKRQGRFEDAGRAYDTALQSAPRDAQLWVDIAHLRYAANNQLSAIEASELALAHDPQHPRALELKAQLVRDAQGLEAALPWFRRALEVAPNDLGLLGEYAATLSDAGRASEMLAVVRQMTELDPGNPRALYLQAVLATRTGRYALARRLLWRTGDRYAQTSAGLLLAAVLDLEEGNAGLSTEALYTLVERQPDNMRFAEWLATALAQDGQTSEVIALFDRRVERAGASTYLIQSVARAHEAQGNRLRAGELLDRAATMRTLQLAPLGNAQDADYAQRRSLEAPGRIDFAIAAIRGQLAAGSFGGAQAASARLGSLFPGAIDVMVTRGDVHLAAGEPAVALGHYARAAAIRTTYSLVLRQLAAYRALGRAAAGEALLAEWVRQHPLDRRAATLLAKLAIESREWGRAGALLAAARPAARNDPDGSARRSIVHMRLSGEGAVADAAAAYAINRSLGAATYAYALALGGAGGDGRARALLSKAEATGAAGGELQSF